MIINGPVNQEYITILNVYAPHNSSFTIYEAKTDQTVRRKKKSPIIVRDFSTPLLIAA